MSERTLSDSVKSSWRILWDAAGSSLAVAMVRAGDVDGFLGLLPWSDWMEQAGAFVDPIQQAADASVRAEMRELGAGSIRGAFDNIDAVAVHYAEREGARLISGLSEAQAQAIRSVMAQALAGKYTVDQAAMLVRSSIGLHERWALAVERRWDAVYSKALKDRLTNARAVARANRLASVYRGRLIASRADGIARTEIQMAVTAGRHAAWSQMVGSGNMSPQARKEWSAGPGACPQCADLSGTVVQWDQQFPGGVSVPAHMRCRCTEVLLPARRDNPILQPTDIDWLNPLQPAGPLLPTA